MRSSLGIDCLGSRHDGIRRRTDHQRTEGRAILLPHRDLDLGRIQAVATSIVRAIGHDCGVFQGTQSYNMIDLPALRNILLLGLGELPGIAMALDSEVCCRILHADFLYFVRREGEIFLLRRSKAVLLIIRWASVLPTR